jgi:signal transduction histidine kinase
MLGQIDVTLRRHRDPDEYRDALLRAQEQGSRLHQIVEMLLFLARSDADARLPDLEVIDLAAWIRTHLQTWSGHPRADDLQLVTPPDDALWVETSPPLLGQLVDNLLDNACKHSAPSTAIIVRLSSQQSSVSLTVEDAGCGIVPDDLPHVFEPFYRSASARRSAFDGVGLGLAVVKRIAVALGGDISVQSQPDRGSRFTMRLPAAAGKSFVAANSLQA